MPKWIDRHGVRYGNLVAVEYLGHKKWRCVCDCGNECIRDTGNLTDKSHCGCLTKERMDAKRGTHRQSQTRLYKRWTGMKQRCENPNANRYDCYGGRGIKVCEEWHDFTKFKEWMDSQGFDPNLPASKQSLDRIDPNGDYSPSNCRLVTASVQMSNRRHYERHDRWKPIDVLDKDGAFIKRFEHWGAAVEWLGDKTKSGTGIYEVINGRQKTAYGYKWRFSETA